MRDMLDDDEVEHAPEPSRWRYWLGAGVTVVGLIAFFMMPHQHTKHAIFETLTTVILPPPPPPKPPTPEPPKTPEPSPNQKTTPNDQPKSANHSASHGAPLTAMAGAGSNAYGLQAGDGSGGDTIGGGDGGEDWSSYSPGISNALQTALTCKSELQTGQYQARVRLWFNQSGVVTKIEMAQSTGDARRDADIQTCAMGARILTNPPAGMPQPLTIRVGATQT
jgi:protein TonB